MATGPTVIDQAAQWFAILRDERASEDDRRRWRRWLAANPEHARAWQRVEALGQPFAGLPGVTPAAAVHDVLARAGAASRRRALRLLGFGGVALGTGLLARHLLPWRDWSYDLALERAARRTGIGEIRSLTLEDGTRLVLNTATAVDLDYGGDFRRIVLHEGEILVSSAPDARRPPRPLVVDTAHGRLTALGTRFSVYGRRADAGVAVYDGTVRVAPAGGGATLDLPAGRQARFDGGQVEPTGAADPAREGWSRGQLIADDIRLDQFLAELARYTPLRMEVADAAAGLRLIGVYALTDPARDVPRTLTALERGLPVLVRQSGPGRVRIERR